MRLYIRFILQEREYSRDLESRILKRTQDLREANQKLKEEAFAREKAQEALEWAKNKAEEANVAKTQFLANMSHELRTPLNAILGYSEILQEDLLDSGQNEYCEDLKSIRQAGNHLLALIDDILDVSRIETGKVNLIQEQFPLSDLIRNVLRTVRPLILKNNNNVYIGEYNTEFNLDTDKNKLHQILQNLLCNAAKFTHEGTVKLEVNIDESGDIISFHVIDYRHRYQSRTAGKHFQCI